MSRERFEVEEKIPNVMSDSEHPWVEVRSERKLHGLRLHRKLGYTKEDAWQDVWQGEGLKRSGAIRRKGYKWRSKRDREDEQNR